MNGYRSSFVQSSRKHSAPVINTKPEDLDLLAAELNQMGGESQQRSHNDQSSESPPPIPPPRDTSILNNNKSSPHDQFNGKPTSFVGQMLSHNNNSNSSNNNNFYSAAAARLEARQQRMATSVNAGSSSVPSIARPEDSDSDDGDEDSESPIIVQAKPVPVVELKSADSTGAVLSSEPPRPLLVYNDDTLRSMVIHNNTPPKNNLDTKPLPPAPNNADVSTSNENGTLIIRRRSSRDNNRSSAAGRPAEQPTRQSRDFDAGQIRGGAKHYHYQQQQQAQHAIRKTPSSSSKDRQPLSPESILSAATGGESPALAAGPGPAGSSSSGDDNSPRNAQLFGRAVFSRDSQTPHVAAAPPPSAGGARTAVVTAAAVGVAKTSHHDERRSFSDRPVAAAATSAVLPDLLPRSKTPPQQAVSSSVNVDEMPENGNDEPRPKLLQKKEKSFLVYGFGAGGTVERPGRSSRDVSEVTVNVNPTLTHIENNGAPEIRKYKKKFSGEILCAALWGVNLIIGTDSGLMLLDRSGQGKVYQLINRRRFDQATVLEGQNILVTISGKKRRIRVYYLSWLKQKILKSDGIEKRNGWNNVGDLRGCIHFKIVRYEKIKFLVVGLENAIEIYAWAPKPYHKFMAFKSFGQLTHQPIIVDLTVEENSRLKVLYGSSEGFHAIDLDSASIYDIYVPTHIQAGNITPHCVVILPNTDGMQLLLCFDNEGVYVNTYGKLTKNVALQWGEMPTSVAYISTGQVMGWGNKAIEIRSVETGHLDGVFMHKKAQKLKFLCERNDKVFFSSAKGGGSCQIYFMTLNKPGLCNW